MSQSKTTLQSILSAYILHKPKLTRALYIAVILGVARRARSLYYSKPAPPNPTPNEPKRKLKRGELDPQFMVKLTKLLKIVIPSWFCKESLLIGLFSGFLVTRTMVLNNACLSVIVIACCYSSRWKDRQSPSPW
jgi:hypothetical protein